MPDSICRAARSGMELRRQLLDEYELDSAAQLALVDTAACALDLALEAEKVIKKEGIITTGARGSVPHPAVMVSKDARNRLMRALGQLNLSPYIRRDVDE